MVNVDVVCNILDKFGFESDPVASLGKLLFFTSLRNPIDESIQQTENEIAKLDKEIRKGVKNNSVSSVKNKRLVDTRRKATSQTRLMSSQKNHGSCQKRTQKQPLILSSKSCNLHKNCF